jgi:hypothetical protein
LHLYGQNSRLESFEIKSKNSEVLVAVVMKTSVFWDIAARSAVKVNRRFGEALLATCFTLVSSIAYFSTLKMEATCRSLTLVAFQLSTLRYIAEYKILQE